MKNQIFCLLIAMLAMAAAPGALAVAQEGFPTQEDEGIELRFQFMSHNFTVDGIEQEIYLKLDRYTGKTWRFSSANPRWTTIAESTSGKARGASNENRYELLSHNYIDQNGDPQEIYIRADALTGYTWAYRGASGTWMDIPQDE